MKCARPLLLALLAVLVPACDESVPTFTPASQPAQQAMARRDIQGEIAGARQRTDLLAFPLTADLPPTWRVASTGGPALVLVGLVPSSRHPSAEIEILMTTRQPITASGLEGLLKEYQRRDADDADVDIRIIEVGGMKLLETMELLDAPTSGPATTAPATAPAVDSAPRDVHWTFRAFAQSGTLDLQEYEFNVLYMNTERLKSDLTFIRSIIESVRRAPVPN